MQAQWCVIGSYGEKKEQETEASNVWKAHEIEGSETKPQEKGMKKELF